VDEATPPLPPLVMGDSAGGALALAVTTRLRDLSRTLSAGVVTLSPWLDATLDEEAVADLEASDPMLAESGLRAAGRWWSRPRHPGDPLVSPVHADLVDLPPLDVFIGRNDILRPAVDDLAARARRDAADLRVREVTAMFHVWMTRGVPKAVAHVPISQPWSRNEPPGTDHWPTARQRRPSEERPARRPDADLAAT